MNSHIIFAVALVTITEVKKNTLMLESSVSEHLLERRKFLKFLGLSSAGVTTAAAIAASREKISDGSELAKAEIENLKQAYEDLDKRSKLILRLILAMSGLDIFLSL